MRWGERTCMEHIDLFSGIGGFALAALWAGFKTEVFCEKDKFCQQVLKKHWPKVPIIEDIGDFDGTKWKGATILTGGFPCQPFSIAGKRRGKEDDRYLWPEMLRVISEAKPTWVLGENVAGIIHLALDQVLADLEGEGYETATFIIPACAINAPHRRDRVWIIAHSECKRPISGEHSNWSRPKERVSQGQNSHASNSKCVGWQERPGKGIQPKKQITERQDTGDSNTKGIASNTSSKGLEREMWSFQQGDRRRFTTQNRGQFKVWDKDWIEVATQLCGVDDGFPAELDGFKLSKSAHRRERLKALGNAIVPQIAMIIMQKIRIIEEFEI